MASARTTRHELAQDHRPTGIGCGENGSRIAGQRQLSESRQTGPGWRIAAGHDSSGAARRTSETGSGRSRVLATCLQVRPSSDRGARDDGHLVARGRAELPLSLVARFTAKRRELAVRSALGATSFRLALGAIAELPIVAGGGAPVSRRIAVRDGTVTFRADTEQSLDMGASIDLRLVGLALGLTVMTMAIVGTYFVAPPCGFRSRLPTTGNPADGARLAVL